MSFKRSFSKDLERIMSKLKRRDKARYVALQKKIDQICKLDGTFIEKHFKNLRGDLSHLKRVHVGSFILTFQVKCNIIVFEEFTHHDEAYRR